MHTKHVCKIDIIFAQLVLGELELGCMYDDCKWLYIHYNVCHHEFIWCIYVSVSHAAAAVAGTSRIQFIKHMHKWVWQVRNCVCTVHASNMNAHYTIFLSECSEKETRSNLSEKEDYIIRLTLLAYWQILMVMMRKLMAS